MDYDSLFQKLAINNKDDNKSEEDKKNLNIEYREYIKLVIANITVLLEEYDDDKDNLNDLINELDDMTKKERRVANIKINSLENKLQTFRKEVSLQWNSFVDAKLNTKQNIMLVSNGDSYYMTCVFRIQNTIKTWKEECK